MDRSLTAVPPAIFQAGSLHSSASNGASLGGRVTIRPTGLAGTLAMSRPGSGAPPAPRSSGRSSSTLLDLAVARVLGVPLKQEHQAERSTPPPLVVHRDTHTTSPHPHPPDRVRRGPLPVHPAQGPAPLGPELPARAAAGRQAQVDPAHGRPAGPRRPRRGRLRAGAGAAAVRQPIPLGPGGGAPPPRRAHDHRDHPSRVGDRRHRLPEVRPLVGRRGAAVLRGAWQGGQLPGRRERARRHRPGQLPAGLAAVLPEEWDSDAERRRKAHVPERERHRPKWQLALEVLDELAAWGLAAPVILADAAYGEIGEFRLGLEQRQLAYVVQVPGTLSAYPRDVVPQTLPYAGRGQPSKPRYRQPRSSLRQLVLAVGERAATTVTWREGADGQRLVSRFVALRVRLAGVKLRQAARGGELPVRWLLAEWPDGEAEPVKYWLASLSETTPLERLVGLAKLRWRVEHDYRELKDALGLDHFEGRSFKGWHHHVTLVSVAHAFVTLERLDPKAPASA